MLISGVLFAGVMLGTLPHMQFQKASWLAVGVVVMGSLTSSLALLWASDLAACAAPLDADS